MFQQYTSSKGLFWAIMLGKFATQFFANGQPTSYRGEEVAGYFEGDMLLTQAQKDMISRSGLNRNGLINVWYRWHENTVPYVINNWAFGIKHGHCRRGTFL